MDIKNKKFLILGMGKTGISTLDFLVKEGAEIRVSDSGTDISNKNEMESYIKKGVLFEFGKHSLQNFDWADTVVLSPGVPFNIEYVQSAINKGVNVISEIELAFNFIRKPIIGVTGSNGKTTTTTLINKILEESGYKVFMGGNIGTPLIDIANNNNIYDFILLELSSFQLQGIKSFKPYISVCLNIYPNHLDHHRDFEEYVDSKLNIFKNQTANDWAILNSDSSVLIDKFNNSNPRTLTFGSSDKADAYEQSYIITYANEIYDLRDIKLLGKHNLENAMAAILVCRILDCDKSIIQPVISKFNSLPHRIEYIRKYNNAQIFNDSKSTTPHATLMALRSFDSPVILIAGGKDKGLDFTVIKDQIKKKVKHLILVGESSNKIKSIYDKYVPVTVETSLDHAVGRAISYVEDAETILFSPGCSSFDMFVSYEERGRRFKEIVKGL